MFARMPLTVLLCLFLPDVAQEEGICDLTVPSGPFSLQSFVPVWNHGGVPPDSTDALFSHSLTQRHLQPVLPGAISQRKCGFAPFHPAIMSSPSPFHHNQDDNTPILSLTQPLCPFCISPSHPPFLFFLVFRPTPPSFITAPLLPLSLPPRRDECRIVHYYDIESCIH